MSEITQNKVSLAAQKDIEELESKIAAFRKGEIPEEKFKAYRLTRGVYGQRQFGVQMFRLKIPGGRISTDQLRTIADLSTRYATGNIHLTTRQNVQFHHVKLDDSPAIWKGLEAAGLTAREACGNTVRNITASHKAGIDPEEPFDVNPYVEAVFQYFLRNPVCQEMGRKIKIAFSSSEKDTAFAFIHDFGFIPRIVNGEKGFKVLVGGGLGAQTLLAQEIYDFLPEERLVSFLEAALRIFDRFGEREKRMKARLKFLIKKIGLTEFKRLVEYEEKVIPLRITQFSPKTYSPEKPSKSIHDIKITDDTYHNWLEHNVFEQKQKGYFGIIVKIPLGDISATKAVQLADLIDDYIGGDIIISVHQGLLIRYAKKDALKIIYQSLKELDLHHTGAERFADVTSCPGTDTCNLAVTNSTALASVLENVIRQEFPQWVNSKLFGVKISGCMNACGQHMIAPIGLHGSSIKFGEKVIPAMQVVLGGGLRADGSGLAAEKIIKLPTKRIPDALRRLLHDYQENASNGVFFPDYFIEKGKMYFYSLLKPLADTSTLKNEDYMDWKQNKPFRAEIGLGECAGVAYDLVSSIFEDAEDKLRHAKNQFHEKQYEHALYNSYNALITTAKALLLSEDISCNTQSGIIKDFDEHFVRKGKISLSNSFEDIVYQIAEYTPSVTFAALYLKTAEEFLASANNYRNVQINNKEVVTHFYKA